MRKERGKEPKGSFFLVKIMIGYKLFRVKKNRPGELFPLYVLSDEPVPTGVWIDAAEGPRTQEGKVKSRIGPLAFRPGWHLSDIPLAVHIGIREDGQIRYMHDDEVWCECVYIDCFDYQEEADQNGWKDGRFDARKAMLTKVPRQGFYRYKTSPQMLGKWIIAGSIRVLRVLSDEEVEKICAAAGYHALPRRTPFNAAAYGL